MTYLSFHLIFLVPPILGLALVLWFWRAEPRISGIVKPVTLIALIAVVYTTPWDNYLVFREVWRYGPDKVLATIGYVPVEEYAFFVLQTILASLVLVVMRRTTDCTAAVLTPGRKNVVSVFLGIATVAGFVCLFGSNVLYLGLILAWATPVMLGQWLLGSSAIAKTACHWGTTVLISTAYLASADRIAIAADTWSISKTYTTGILVLGLPVEELLFFLVTNVMVVWGIVLFDHYQERWKAPKSK